MAELTMLQTKYLFDKTVSDFWQLISLRAQYGCVHEEKSEAVTFVRRDKRRREQDAEKEQIYESLREIRQRLQDDVNAVVPTTEEILRMQYERSAKP